MVEASCPRGLSKQMYTDPKTKQELLELRSMKEQMTVCTFKKRWVNNNLRKIVDDS